MLLYFILGMLTVQVFFPLLDGITAALLTMLEAFKGYFNMKVVKFNTEIRKMSEEPEEKKRLIGFNYEEEEYDD